MENAVPDHTDAAVTATHSIARRTYLIWLSWLFAGCGAPEPVAFHLRVEPNPTDPLRIEVVVEASDATAWRTLDRSSQAADIWERILALRLHGLTNRFMPALLSDYHVIGNKLLLRPRFRLLAGESYEAVFDPVALGSKKSRSEVLTVTYRVPTPQTNTQPRLVAIYPSGDAVPANHLKFYLLFSEPMRKGEFLRHIKLMDESGTEVFEPFRETELWSQDDRRLTLWLHPGRQKTGVNLNVELGPVLQSGHHYRLVVSGDWPTQTGVPLGKATEKRFAAGPTEHSQLRLSDWQILPPATGSREPLRVEFPKPLDWALLQSQLVITGPDGAKMNGKSTTAGAERSWSFSPDEPWLAGEYQLDVGSVLEDLAGNSLARPFEVDLEKPSEPASPKTLALKFIVSPVRTKK